MNRSTPSYRQSNNLRPNSELYSCTLSALSINQAHPQPSDSSHSAQHRPSYYLLVGPPSYSPVGGYQLVYLSSYLSTTEYIVK
ncbi:hypothetical protein ASPBRDRAFT_38396 [Aspergillus brasiliensis CBS 101740]|uniref:Uncharacterized protein n=1 Tax=Aspergillus brasiliensis (strain CBS 101740 / IMI 381727 / IBT 21946) TaxID=767769 RepID=A0A1L9UWE6_ASPBC|nr:hypothetical protein ASPBRDRAFT_38396 [Aspergillus brasiliensis CBS 101740]